ncbi:probable serine/threonine-protein kinase PIX13 [Rutidosis leptorrhynchoides]|uniref:probable serine/threonine-protein kinase PIX13 n=1 Tax=Rutidosis leptorrhynchoides TaxID=125765 RepID=UPI003A990AF6
MGNCFPKPVNNLSNTNKIPTPTVVTSDVKKKGPMIENRPFTAAGGGGATANSGETVPPIGKIVTPELKCFTYSELKSATRNFRPDTILGEGGFGRVFKGWVDGETYAPSKVGIGIPVAVKKSNQDSAQGLKEWQAEVNFLGKFSHPNLVKLVGYCWEDREFILVYEHVQKGSLENHLFKKGAEPLPWSTRLKIATGAAQGLAFLHTTEKKVIYRDFKSANILLDGEFIAKLSDFGLAKLGPANGDSHVSTGVVGTYGYAAPEYIATGHLYVKSDVYGFGVVLLEIITGLRVLDTNRPSSQHNLVDWARPALPDKRKLRKLMDPRLGNDYPSKGAFKAAELILNCLEPDPKNRPSMLEVMVSLQEISAIKTKPKEVKVHATQLLGPRRDRLYRSAHQSPLHMKQGGGARPGLSPIRSY